jgi:hypothetical protein
VLLPLRKQELLDASQPKGQLPFGGFATASCAPADGTQNEPLAANSTGGPSPHAQPASWRPIAGGPDANAPTKVSGGGRAT